MEPPPSMPQMKSSASDVRSLAMFLVGMSVGICLMLIYMGLRERNIVITRIMIDPSAQVEED